MIVPNIKFNLPCRIRKHTTDADYEISYIVGEDLEGNTRFAYVKFDLWWSLKIGFTVICWDVDYDLLINAYCKYLNDLGIKCEIEDDGKYIKTSITRKDFQKLITLYNIQGISFT